MAAKKPISWFLSHQGRQFSFAVVTTAGIGLSVARYVPNTFLINKYKDFVQYYKESKPVELSKELQERCKKCLDILNLPDVHRKLIHPFSVYGFDLFHAGKQLILNLPDVHRKLIHPFSVYGFDLFHAGSTSSKFGVIIGIPVNFSYKSLEDIEKDNVQVNQKTVDLKSDVGRKLGEALLLPEKVQEFAICREILMTQNNKIMYESAYPFFCMFFAYNLSHYLNKRLNLYAAPPPMRATLYGIVGMFSLGIYFLMKDMTETSYEAHVDRKLCELGPEYVESGVVFYKKLLQRNQALRELMGDEGKRKYSAMGNENYGIRQPRMALVHRKQFFESMMKELGKGEVLENMEAQEYA